jgi:DNA helicase-2/ATP-dependent DNA helicase PcrA
MAWNDGLDIGTPAHGIAASTHRRLRVLAGPGTGKSFAMKRRVARILEEGTAPVRILPVTFTRVAAEDLHRELVSLGVEGSDRLRGKTLHGLAMSILMRNHVLAALGRTPRPLNKFELEPLLSDLSNVHGDKHQRKRLIRAYGAAWARLQVHEPGFARSPEDQAFVDELVSWLRFHKAMLMDEVIPHLFEYLRTNPGTQEYNEFAHILVDEYQDLNKAEQEVIRLLGTNGSICVIGDDDQSIYSFRHAHPQGIREWARLHTSDEHAIVECRRCPTSVVGMANALISRNTERLLTAMQERPANGQGEVVIRQYSNVDVEAEAVSTKITSLIQGGIPPGEIVVLTQRETFATPIFNRLREQNIPVKSYYAESELDTLYAQERFAILKLFIDSEDRVALRWLLGRGTTNWRTSSYKRIMNHSRTSGLSPWWILNAISDGTLDIPYAQPLVSRFEEIKTELASLNAVRDNLENFIEAWLGNSEDAQLLSELVTKCKEGLDTPKELFDKLYESVTHPEVPDEIEEVRIMSLHKSKGLSSPFVFIVGCVEGLLPGRLDDRLTPQEQEAKLEEDRRLFYVGVTRVKSDPARERVGYLALTYAQKMRAKDAYASQITPVSVSRGIAVLQASRFISEMAPHAPNPQLNSPL